ncbi:Xylene monooxygenase electron transfer component [Streptomyces netropsis]|uniref:globin domain-containing protein n=1 Tax=Streptomyces syringium TaxID=76729 RepID=UPI0010144651|nr:globin domain-containing protein [Streptomyces syringium]SPE53806.1 Xylene monooxygenase electron transfer component [Streptomyces netropsis]
MDAPTPTSADGGSFGTAGERGWFTPPRPVPDTPAVAPEPSGEVTAGDTGGSRDRPPGWEPVARAVVPETERDPGYGSGLPISAVWQTEPPPPAPSSRWAPLYHSGYGGGVQSAPPEPPEPPDRREPYAPPERRDRYAPPDRTAPPDQQVHPGQQAPPPSRGTRHRRPVETQPPAPGSAAPARDQLPIRPTRSGASPDTLLIRRTLAEIAPVADKTTSYFYALLFIRHPDLRSLFPVAMDVQRDRLFKALLTAAEHADDTATLTEYLSHLGRGHRKYGTLPEHYPAVGECLIAALTRFASDTWSEATEAAWVRVYTTVSQIMIDAAAEDERSSPAWWQAEVVGHELRTRDIAVVTVRPEEPYPFLAGQYTSLETPWWPRIWRNYSFSSAPRSDGLLSFHVKAIPAGWVSNALVHHARPGDVLRLGPPAGSMIVDHTTDNGLLCLGGGTGIAPIKALVEDVAEHGRRRPVEVFYGARHDDDLYDIDTMLGLQRSHPWLSVRPVVSDGPTRRLSGQLTHIVREYGPWPAYDAYLSGPPGMIRSGVDTLVGIGIPSHRIRHDGIEELTTSSTGRG